MGRAKEIVLKVIPAKIARPFICAHHYSGKFVNNSSLHFGAFLDGGLHGVLAFGPSMDKTKVLPLVRDTAWNGAIELNRMAFDDYLPRNSESFCIGRALRLIKKNAPQVEWVISYADGTQCGDGTIYRASNFVLTGISQNTTIMEAPWGQIIAKISITANPNGTQIRELFRRIGRPDAKYISIAELKRDYGFRDLPGYMLRYIYFLNPKARERLTVPIIPFSKIDELGAGLYKGEKITRAERHVECEAQKQTDMTEVKADD